MNCTPSAYFAISKDRIGLVSNFKNQSFIAVTDTVDGEFYQFNQKIVDSGNVRLEKSFTPISADEKVLFQSISKRTNSKCPEYPPDSVIGFVVNKIEL